MLECQGVEDAPMRPDRLPSPVDPHAKTVLLAEADDAVRGELARELRADGYQVVELADGVTLSDYLELAQLSQGSICPPDLILSDVELSGCSGLKLCQMLSHLHGRAPFILLASRTDAECWDNAEEAGAAHVLDKPVDLNQLHDAIDCYLEDA